MLPLAPPEGIEPPFVRLELGCLTHSAKAGKQVVVAGASSRHAIFWFYQLEAVRPVPLFNSDTRTYQLEINSRMVLRAKPRLRIPPHSMGLESNQPNGN